MWVFRGQINIYGNTYYVCFNLKTFDTRTPDFLNVKNQLINWVAKVHHSICIRDTNVNTANKMKTATFISMTFLFPLTLANAIPALLGRDNTVICCNACTDQFNCDVTYCGIDRSFDFFVNWCFRC